MRINVTTLSVLQSQLESVQTAIARIESTGQAYGRDGNSLNRADLKTLYDREKYLENRIARAQRTGGGMRVRFITPT